MRKKSTYLYFLAVIAIIVAVGYIMNISVIKSITNSVISALSNPWIYAGGAVSAFIFTGNKYYWLINIVAGLVVALAIQFFVVGGSIVLFTIFIRTLAFLCIVYLLNLIRILVTK